VAGTDIVLSLDGRAGLSDDGHLQQRGMFGNLPAGEGYVAPLETAGDGTIVFDGSLAGYGLLTTPVRVTVERGRAVDADTDAGEWLLETLDAGGEHGRSLAELGIGTNPAAIVTGNVLAPPQDPDGDSDVLARVSVEDPANRVPHKGTAVDLVRVLPRCDRGHAPASSLRSGRRNDRVCHQSMNSR
jgi:hypothetical protein